MRVESEALLCLASPICYCCGGFPYFLSSTFKSPTALTILCVKSVFQLTSKLAPNQIFLNVLLYSIKNSKQNSQYESVKMQTILKRTNEKLLEGTCGSVWEGITNSQTLLSVMMIMRVTRFSQKNTNISQDMKA